MPCHPFPSLPFPSLPFPCLALPCLALPSLQYILPCLETIGEDDRAADIHVVTSSNGHRGLLNAGSQSDQRVKLDKLVEISLLNCSVNKVGKLNTVFRL